MDASTAHAKAIPKCMTPNSVSGSRRIASLATQGKYAEFRSAIVTSTIYATIFCRPANCFDLLFKESCSISPVTKNAPMSVGSATAQTRLNVLVACKAPGAGPSLGRIVMNSGLTSSTTLRESAARICAEGYVRYTPKVHSIDGSLKEKCQAPGYSFPAFGCRVRGVWLASSPQMGTIPRRAAVIWFSRCQVQSHLWP